MKTATSTSRSLILAATIALSALVTPKTTAAGSDERNIAEAGHSLKVGDVVFYDADAGKHVAVPISYLMGEVKDGENELLLVTSVAQDGFRASSVEDDEDEDVTPQIAKSDTPADEATVATVAAPQAANDGDTVVLVIKHADAEALRTALAAVLGKDATVTVSPASVQQEVLAMTN